MADFYVNGDNRFKKNLIKLQEDLLKADVMLVKKDVNTFPTILPEPEDKLFSKYCDRKEEFNNRTEKFKRSKKQATVTKRKNVIEEKKSAPPDFQKYVLETFASQPTIQKCFKIKSSNYSLHNEDTKPNNNSQKSLPLNKKINFGLQVTNIDKTDHTSKCKLKDEKSSYLEDDNILNIFTPSNDQSDSSSHSFSDKLVIKKSKSGRKYSWQDINSWLSPSQKENIDNKQKALDCKKTYSWEILGIGTQTSDHDLQNIDVSNRNSKHECTVKYSWQIIGKSTQASLHDYEDHLILNEDYWKGLILSPRKKYVSQKNIETPTDCLKSPNKVRILYCERTQTSSDKKIQTELTDCRIKYSWENLIKQHLDFKSSKFMNSDKLSYDHHCVKHLRSRMDPIKKCSPKYSWENLISQHLKS